MSEGLLEIFKNSYFEEHLWTSASDSILFLLLNWTLKLTGYQLTQDPKCSKTEEPVKECILLDKLSKAKTKQSFEMHRSYHKKIMTSTCIIFIINESLYEMSVYTQILRRK